jgi:hypothetical protein
LLNHFLRKSEVVQGIFIVSAQFQRLLIGIDRTRVVALLEAGIAEIIEGIRLDVLAFDAGKRLTGILVTARTVERDAASVVIGKTARRSRLVSVIEFSGGVLLRGFEQGSAGRNRHGQ